MQGVIIKLGNSLALIHLIAIVGLFPLLGAFDFTHRADRVVSETIGDGFAFLAGVAGDSQELRCLYVILPNEQPALPMALKVVVPKNDVTRSSQEGSSSAVLRLLFLLYGCFVAILAIARVRARSCITASATVKDRLQTIQLSAVLMFVVAFVFV